MQIAFWAQSGAPSTAWAMTSLDGGGHFGAAVELSAGAGALHPAAAIAADGVAHFVWYDRPDGRDEAYYRSLSVR